MAEYFSLKAGDTLPVIVAVLSDADGVVNLTDVDASDVRFRMRLDGATTLTVDAVATIDDAAAGQVSYAWAEADTDTAGSYEAEWQVTFPTGERATFPNDGYVRIVILPGLSA